MRRKAMIEVSGLSKNTVSGWIRRWLMPAALTLCLMIAARAAGRADRQFQNVPGSLRGKANKPGSTIDIGVEKETFTNLPDPARPWFGGKGTSPGVLPVWCREMGKRVTADDTGIYFGGDSILHNNTQWKIEKRTHDGALIWQTASNPSPANDLLYALAVGKSGLYVAGSYGIPHRWRIEKRRSSDGELLWALDYSEHSGCDYVRGVATNDSGIYVTGRIKLENGDYGWRTEKRNKEDGSFIWGHTENPGDWDQSNGIAVNETGVYIAGCYSPPGEYPAWYYEKRRLDDGELIWWVAGDPSPSYEWAFDVAVDETGIYACGTDRSQGNSQWRIEKRRFDDGSIIWEETINPSPYDELAWGLSVDDSGVYVVGTDSSGLNSKWRIERRDREDGALVWESLFDPSESADRAYDVAVDDRGVFVVGYDRGKILTNERWRIGKFRRDNGDLAWTYVADFDNDVAQDVASDDTGIYIIGTADDKENGHTTCWQIQKRRLNDGNLVWNIASNPSTGFDVPLGITTDDTGVYIGGMTVPKETVNGGSRREVSWTEILSGRGFPIPALKTTFPST